MGMRSVVFSSIIVAVFSFASLASADVPAGTGGGSSSSSGGAGGAADDPNCTVSAEAVAGTTCNACDPSKGACSDQLGVEYNFVCRQTAKAEVWCNGPDRSQYNDNNVACSTSLPGGPLSGMAACALVAAAALFARRRRG